MCTRCCRRSAARRDDDWSMSCCVSAHSWMISSCSPRPRPGVDPRTPMPGEKVTLGRDEWVEALDDARLDPLVNQEPAWAASDGSCDPKIGDARPV